MLISFAIEVRFCDCSRKLAAILPLKDVSSFANADGGDLIIGVDEAEGIPTAIPGVVVADVDAEKLSLEETIRRGIEPRIDFAIHSV